MSTSTAPTSFNINFNIDANKDIEVTYKGVPAAVKLRRDVIQPMEFLVNLDLATRKEFDDYMSEKFKDFILEFLGMKCTICAESFFLSVVEIATKELRDKAIAELRDFDYDIMMASQFESQEISNELDRELTLEKIKNFDKLNEIACFTRAYEKRFDVPKTASPYYGLFKRVDPFQKSTGFVRIVDVVTRCKGQGHFLPSIVQRIVYTLIGHKCAAAYMAPSHGIFTKVCGIDNHIYNNLPLIPEEWHKNPIEIVLGRSYDASDFLAEVIYLVRALVNEDTLVAYSKFGLYTPIVKIVVLAVYYRLLELSTVRVNVELHKESALNFNHFQDILNPEAVPISMANFEAIYNHLEFNEAYLNIVNNLAGSSTKHDYGTDVSNRMLKLIRYIQKNTLKDNKELQYSYESLSLEIPTLMYKIHETVDHESFNDIYRRNFHMETNSNMKFIGMGVDQAGTEVRVLSRSKFTAYAQLYLRDALRSYQISRYYRNRDELLTKDFMDRYKSLVSFPVTYYQSKHFYTILHYNNIDETSDTELETDFLENLEYLRECIRQFEKGKLMAEGEAYKLMRNALILPSDPTYDGYESDYQFYKNLLSMLHQHGTN
ncbi:MAG: hypothetical protein IM488_01660 [Microcystis sp. M025S2]|uniref:hypothetical protein n=1 Tax=Microcystis sp. M025S2 TaxID=2771161 RepID=UPI00258CA77E|nr:hypothetical protein [Microcystis sp. M025S2]MCA2708143.1 hypothetical protein [Microcystis sp. M025S2]